MPGLFQGLEIGKRALLAQQANLQTAGHNIANVGTPGFSRQRVRVSSTSPENLTYGSIGTGIRVDDIRHIRDMFLGEQYRQATKELGKWTYKERTLVQIESVFNEPYDDSLNDVLNQFWDSWSDLSANSDSTSQREMVTANARQLINSFRQLSRRLSDLSSSVNDDLTGMTNKVNSLTREIARINQQIKTSELGGSNANDLRDARDLLTDELSTLVDVSTREKENGATIVYMGGMAIVDGSNNLEIGTTIKKQGGVSTNILVWKGTSIKLTNLSGQLAGLVESRDKDIPESLNKLNDLAKAIVEGVNAIHRNGYGLNRSSSGINFFDPSFTDAATIRLNLDIDQDVNKVASSSTADGNNLIALQLSGLRNQTVLADNTQTIEEYYQSMIGILGVDTNEASSFRSNLELLQQQTEFARQSVQGVSLDEEMANMIKFQHAYDAAARVITTMDHALDTVINGMGLVGR